MGIQEQTIDVNQEQPGTQPPPIETNPEEVGMPVKGGSVISIISTSMQNYPDSTENYEYIYMTENNNEHDITSNVYTDKIIIVKLTIFRNKEQDIKFSFINKLRYNRKLRHTEKK